MNSNALVPREVSRRIPASGLRQLIGQHLSELVGILVAVALAIFFTIESPNFFTFDNALVLSQFIAPFAIFALAEVPVLILGEIDLSVGQMYIVSPFFVTYLNHAGVPVLPCIVLALLVCCWAWVDQRPDHRQAPRAVVHRHPGNGLRPQGYRPHLFERGADESDRRGARWLTS